MHCLPDQGYGNALILIKLLVIFEPILRDDKVM